MACHSLQENLQQPFLLDVDLFMCAWIIIDCSQSVGIPVSIPQKCTSRKEQYNSNFLVLVKAHLILCMAEEQGHCSQFGDVQTADVTLQLISINGDTWPPLHLHSHVLCRSEFFETRLSERWAIDDRRPVKLILDKCRKPEIYKRCIEVMYSPDRLKDRFFADVQDALTILEVAAELLFHDCVNACMQFLEAVPWTSENENAIKSCLSSLHLQVFPDLAARLCTAESILDCKPVEIMQEVIQNLLSLVRNEGSSRARDITEAVLVANVQPPVSPAFAAANELALYKEFKCSLDLIKTLLWKFANGQTWSTHQFSTASSMLRWVLEKLFAFKVAELAIKTFAEEHDLAQAMIFRIWGNPFTETLLHVLAELLQGLQTADIIVSRSVRLALITNWLPVLAQFNNVIADLVKWNDLLHNVEAGLCALVATLPILDQEEVFKIWIRSCLKYSKSWPNLSTAFDLWCNKLRQAQNEKDQAAATSEVGNVKAGSAKLSVRLP